MMTKEEREELINAAVERALLMIPEVVGNMMTNQATMTKINREFYQKFPEFKERKDVVVSVVEMIEGKDPTVSYEKILEKAVPEIRKRLAVTKTLDITEVPSDSSRDFSGQNFSNYGDI